VTKQTTHYIYRAILSPLLLNPSMAPIHAFVFLSAAVFQVLNGLSIGGYLGGYGPTSPLDWAARPAYAVPLGIAVWAAGLAGNVYHDDILRAIRRDADRKTREKKERAPAGGEGRVEKVYEIPRGGLFGLVLYAHYFCEWVEWCGFWMVGGMACVPAQTFVLNEVTTMLPRAWNGWHWYVGRFGREKIGTRKAVVPWLI
jgi:3-oxo-5-alpha-steroid 4-dehydrogenase 1